LSYCKDLKKVVALRGFQKGRLIAMSSKSLLERFSERWCSQKGCLLQSSREGGILEKVVISKRLSLCKAFEKAVSLQRFRKGCLSAKVGKRLSHYTGFEKAASLPRCREGRLTAKVLKQVISLQKFSNRSFHCKGSRKFQVTAKVLEKVVSRQGSETCYFTARFRNRLSHRKGFAESLIRGLDRGLPCNPLFGRLRQGSELQGILFEALAYLQGFAF
jgi:hypothetical protein